MIIEFCKIAGMMPDELLGRSRRPGASEARQMYWKLLHHNGFSMVEIGRLNERRHSTVSLGIKHINGIIATCRDSAELWNRVKGIKRN